MPVPPQRVSYDSEDGIREADMELVSNIISLDANSLYPFAMRSTLHGLGVLRTAEDSFAGSILGKGLRY